MKYGIFMRVKFWMREITRTGQYEITANYQGLDIKVRSTNSEVWEWLDDNSNVDKCNSAKRYCYHAIINEYVRMINEADLKKVDSVEEFMEEMENDIKHCSQPVDEKNFNKLLKLCRNVMKFGIHRYKTESKYGYKIDCARIDRIYKLEIDLINANSEEKKDTRMRTIEILDRDEKCLYSLIYTPITTKRDTERIDVEKTYFE